MSSSNYSITTPLLQAQHAIQGPASNREPGPQRQVMDLDRRIQALELELLTGGRAREESGKLMWKRTILRLCCCPYQTAACAAAPIVIPLLSLLTVPFRDRAICHDCCRCPPGCCDRMMEVFLGVCFCCEKEVSYPERPGRRVKRYFPDILCGIDTPIDPTPMYNPRELLSNPLDAWCDPSPQKCCCCADYCADFVDRRVDSMQIDLRLQMEELKSVTKFSRRATQVYDVFERVTREGRLTIPPEEDACGSFDVPQSLMGIIAEYEYEVPDPTYAQIGEIPLPEDHQQMMQIPLPADCQMRAEEIVVYRRNEYKKAEFRKRELEITIRKMKADCVKAGVKLPIGLKV